MQVDGKRYWSQRIDCRQHGSMLQSLCDRATLFVKKRARALAYSDDPTGVRSLLSTLFNPSGLPQQTSTPSHDLMQMCWTFSSDPFVASFALAFCLEDGSQGLPMARGAGAPLCGGSLRAYMRRTLSECVMHEQGHLLLLRLQVFFCFQVRHSQQHALCLAMARHSACVFPWHDVRHSRASSLVHWELNTARACPVMSGQRPCLTLTSLLRH